MCAKTCRKFRISPSELFENVLTGNNGYSQIRDIPFKKVKLHINPQTEASIQLEFFKKQFGLDENTVLNKLESVSGDWRDLIALLSNIMFLLFKLIYFK